MHVRARLTAAFTLISVLAACTSHPVEPSPTPFSGETAAALDRASAEYTTYVQMEVTALYVATESFAAAFSQRDDGDARTIYVEARAHWLAIEPVVRDLGDFYVAIGARESDLLAREAWTGWHHAEKELWPPAGFSLTDAERHALANQLVADTKDLHSLMTADDFVVPGDQIADAAQALVDAAAFRTVTGQEEVWSGTDLWAVYAQLEGVREAVDALRPLLDDELTATLLARLAAAHAELAAHGSPQQGFAHYDDLAAHEVRNLARAIDALAESLDDAKAATVP